MDTVCHKRVLVGIETNGYGVVLSGTYDVTFYTEIEILISRIAL